MAISDPIELSRWIKQRSAEMGFSACGISRAGHLGEEAPHLRDWLEKGYHGGMHFMTRYNDKRVDPTLLLRNARSLISFLASYKPPELLPSKDNYRLARYAYGKDYHTVLKSRMWQLITGLRTVAVDFTVRVYADSAPVLEKAWAARSGLGWIGKNTCLIHPKFGSFVFIGEILTDLELEPDHVSVNDLCGGCELCIENCPTGAILSPQVLDSRKCISYQTIENRSGIPIELKEHFQDWIFGCDICQEVCPWNRKALSHHDPEFMPGSELVAMRKSDWETLDPEKYAQLFHDSAIERAGYEGLKKNIRYVSEKA